jgi:CRP-like cAMP-binding protein
MKEILRDYLCKNFEAPAEEVDVFVNSFESQSFKKNEILISRDEICKYSFFICKGSARAYFITEQGFEATRYIALENQFITTIHSFISQNPTNEYIETTEETDLLKISHQSFKSLVCETTLAKELYIKQLEFAYTTNHWRLESFLKLTAKQRYEFLLKTNPSVIQRLPNKIIASYLGITQESLSRLKAKK